MPIIEQVKDELDEELLLNQVKLKDKNIVIESWNHLYELSYIEHLTLFIHALGMQDQVVKMRLQQNPNKAFIDQGFLDAELLDEKTTQAEVTSNLPYYIGLTYSLFLTIKSLMVYGRYLNELVAIARNTSDTIKGDKALLQAIRIDPSAIGCSTALSRISHATVMNDTKFLDKLTKALKGKLGKGDAKNYQQMRFILQVLLDTGANELSDKDLKELFVNQLNLYSDSQHTAEKNISEFTRNFLKQKSTI